MKISIAVASATSLTGWSSRHQPVPGWYPPLASLLAVRLTAGVRPFLFHSMQKHKRIGVTNYILGNSLAILGWSVLTVVLCESFVRKGTLSKDALTFVVSTAAALVGVLFYSLSAWRLKDLNMSGWLVKVLAFPIPGLIILPYLCFTPGSTGSNDYGEEPEGPGVARVLITILLALLSFTFFAGAWTTYHTTMRH